MEKFDITRESYQTVTIYFFIITILVVMMQKADIWLEIRNQIHIHRYWYSSHELNRIIISTNQWFS